jgi:hypothetical protein
MAAESDASSQQFEQRAFFDYHIYELGRKVSIGTGDIKQIPLFESMQIPCEKEYVYEANRNPEKISITLSFENSGRNAPDRPLPAGVVRLYKKSEGGGGHARFIGEDAIPHIPKEGDVRLNIGTAFDLAGKRSVQRRERGTFGGRSETIEITLANHSGDDVDITVIEHYYGYWEIDEASEEYKKKDANTVAFELNIQSGAEKTLQIEISYRR